MENPIHGLSTCVNFYFSDEPYGLHESARQESEFSLEAAGEDGRQELIQVSNDLYDTATMERETRALEEAASGHRKATRHLISLDLERPPGLQSGITWYSAAAWLLGGSPMKRRTLRLEITERL